MVRRSNIFVTATLTLLMAGCVQTTYRPYAAQKNGEDMMSRNVFFDLSPAFYKSPPNCITVLAVAGTKDRRFAKLVEKTAARHLSGRVRRVIGSLERQRRLRKMALDLGNPSDRKRYASATRCNFFAVPTVNSAAEGYYVFWSQREVKLSLELFRLKSGILNSKKSGKWSQRYSRESKKARSDSSWERVWRATSRARACATLYEPS